MAGSKKGSCNPPADSMDSILAAILNDNRPGVRKLLKESPQLATQLIDTAKFYNSKIFHWIYVGDTALHLAAAGYRVEIVELLLSAGADPNSAENHRRSSPLHYAADGFITGINWNETRQVKTIGCLLGAGANFNAQDKNGATPLHRAVRTPCAAAVKYLLARGSEAVLKNKSGSTPFHLAVQNTGRGGTGEDKAKAAQLRIIRQFLSFGLSPSLKDGKGKSVFACAQSEWIRNALSENDC
jgi:hypothetical protein